MKILLINQFFWPDSSATSQMLTDLATGLAERGHEIYSISAAAGGYAPVATQGAPDVRRSYVRTFPFIRGKLGRMVSYASFYVTALFSALTLTKMDVVVTLTTPPLLSLIGSILKQIKGARHFIWEMDMYPDVAVDTGYFKAGGLADRFTGALADWSRSKADGVIALGECMRDRLLARGTAPDKIFISYNWADSEGIEALPYRGSTERLTVLYSGNLGLAHDLDTIFGAMRNLKTDDRFRFAFVGSGGRRAELSDFAEREQVSSIELRPYVDRVSLSESLAVGDIGLVTQKDSCCGTVVPSKVYGLLAAGRPILFIGPANAMPARIIRQYACGWHIPVGHIESLTALLLRLAAHPEELREAGRRGREALVAAFDRPIGIARIAEILGARQLNDEPASFAPAVELVS